MATNKKVGTKLNDMSVERLIADFRACERLADDLATDPKTISDSRAKQNLRALENRMDVIEAELNRRGLDYDGQPIPEINDILERSGRHYIRWVRVWPTTFGNIAWGLTDAQTGHGGGGFAPTYSSALAAIENWIEGAQSSGLNAKG